MATDLPGLSSTITIEPTGESYCCNNGESLLRGMLRLGRKGIPVGCVNGGCGVCKIQIISGEVRKLGPVSRAHVREADEAKGYALACRVEPRTSVKLSVIGHLKKSLSRRARSQPTTLAKR